MLDEELIVDSFAGGGGASHGIKAALGRGPDIAINHDKDAIAMHAANHPETRHFTESVWKVNPRVVTKGRPVGLLWASPDCKHFSRAKGGKPVEKGIRSLAWVVVQWAKLAKPRVVILENVREFEDWGPLLPLWSCKGCDWKGTEGQARLARTRRRCPRCDSRSLVETDAQVPDPDRKGLTFRRWVGRLKALGYAVEWRVLNAADFGAPTHRRRLFLIARRDGEPICWPDPTHGDPKKLGQASLWGEALKPWRTAAECIDWSLPCPSIFLTREEGRAVGVNRPLAEKTLKRIALGIKRYVLDNPRPFIVTYYGVNKPSNEFRGQPVEEPFRTMTAEPRFGVVTPYVVGVGGRAGQSPATSTSSPIGTITAKNDRALVTPLVVPITHAGERRAHPLDEPLPTVTGANRGEMAVIAPVIGRLGQTGGNGKYSNGADEPVTTITSKAEHFEIAATLIQTGYGERDGQAPRVLDIEAPMGTAVAGGCKQALVAATLVGAGGPDYAAKPREIDRPMGAMTAAPRTALATAFLAKHFGGVVGHKPDRPIGTVTATDHHSLVAANLVHLNHGEKQWSAPDDPLRTATTGNHAALVYSFMVKYFGQGVGQPLSAPLHTATTKDRFGLITVMVDGEPHVIVDIGMRMLRPRELARGQGFPDSYLLTGTASKQVARIGNSVCPVMAEALVRANLVESMATA